MLPHLIIASSLSFNRCSAQADLDKLKTSALQAMKVSSPTTSTKRDNSHLAAKKPAAKRDNSYLAAKKPAVKSTRQYNMPANRYSSSQKNNWQNSSAAPYQMVRSSSCVVCARTTIDSRLP